MLLVEEEEREGLHEETLPSLLGPRQGGRASDTQRRHLHAMISLLRPEDTVKLVRISLTHSCFTIIKIHFVEAVFNLETLSIKRQCFLCSGSPN